MGRRDGLTDKCSLTFGQLGQQPGLSTLQSLVIVDSVVYIICAICMFGGWPVEDAYAAVARGAVSERDMDCGDITRMSRLLFKSFRHYPLIYWPSHCEQISILWSWWPGHRAHRSHLVLSAFTCTSCSLPPCRSPFRASSTPYQPHPSPLAVFSDSFPFSNGVLGQQSLDLTSILLQQDFPFSVEFRNQRASLQPHERN